MPYITSVEQMGYDRGVTEEAKRLLETQRSLLIRQLTRKVGPIPINTIERINILQIDQLESLGEVLFDFESIADLDSWLQT